MSNDIGLDFRESDEYVVDGVCNFIKSLLVSFVDLVGFFVSL